MSQSVVAIKGVRKNSSWEEGTEYICIPVAGSYTTDSNGKIKINSTAKSRYISSCYALWGTNHCEVTGAQVGGVGSYLFYFYALGGVTVCKNTNSWISGDAPNTYVPLALDPHTITAYTTSLQKSTGGSVSVSMGSQTLNVQEWWTSPRIETSGFTATYGGKTVSQSVFNNSGALHLGGEVVTFSATPDANYGVADWTIAYSGKTETKTGNSISVTLPSADVVVTCNFKKTQGLVTIKSEDTSVLTVTNAMNNQTIKTGRTITATAKVVNSQTHEFIGWFKNDSTTAFTTSSTFTVRFDGVDVTYTAKCRSKLTTVNVSTVGSGTFDITLGGETKTGLTSYTNANAIKGQSIKLVAKPASDFFLFDHWISPFGSSNTQKTYDETISTTLESRASNDFTAIFIAKEKKPVTLIIENIGRVNYKTFHSEKYGESISADGIEIAWSFFEASDFTFEAEDLTDLYTFDHYEYRANGVWSTLSAYYKPDWIKSVEGRVIVANISKDSEDDTRGLKAIFRKNPTFAIPGITISGRHPYRGTVASNEGCMVSIKDLPSPAETVSGVNKYFEGQPVEFVVQPGTKWDFDKITVVFSDGTSPLVLYEGAPAFELERDISSITATFVPKKIKVNVSLEEASAAVGEFTISGEDGDGNIEFLSDYINVLIDTDISISAISKVSDAAFYSWTYNNSSFYNATQTFRISSESNIVARFSSKHTFGIFRNADESGTVLGTVVIQYNDGTGSKTKTLQDTTAFEVMLLCGTTFSIAADKETGESFFGGWFDASGNRISGWGNEVSGIVVSTPRAIRAKYVKEELWPILRIRKASASDAVEFNIRGAKTEREQVVSDTKTITLREGVDDYFFDPYSTALIELSIANGADLFMGWKRYEFGTVEQDGTEPLSDDFYSTDQNLLILVSEDIFLKPIFYTDDPITVTLGYVEGSNNASGSLYLDGTPIEQISQSIAKFKFGDKVDLVAMPSNGNRFVGWYLDAQGRTFLTDSTRHTITVENSDGYIYYAKFEKDTNSICTFDATNEAKTMVWHSKRVMVNTPMHFSVAQVDAEDYGEDGPKLSVLKASSPDIPAEGKTYKISNGNSRRLSIEGRGEKCFEFVVESSTPVNRVSISTSVSGLIGGAS